MTDLSLLAHQPRILVVGSGVVGAALADELTLLGMSEVTVVDQGPLYTTGGSSSHAPGFVYQTTPSKVMSELAQRTLDKLDGAELDGEWVLKRVGGLEIAVSQARLEHLHRRAGMAASWGIDASVVSPDQCAQLWPGLDPDVLLGGLYTPTDGVVKSLRAVQWQAERAIARGATFHAHTQVVGYVVEHGRIRGVQVRATPGSGDAAGSTGAMPHVIQADVVIACGGLWGPTLGALAGIEVPMLPMEHCLTYTRPVASLAGLNTGLSEISRPMIRHQDAGLYVRESGAQLAIGTYGHRPIGLEQSQVTSPEHFAATGVHPAMHDLTMPDFEPSWREARRVIPELAGVELDWGFNGIFSFTPDGHPLMGEVPGVEGLWMAQAVWVTQSAGVAQVLARWLVRDDPGVDTALLDLKRFDPAVLTHSFTVARGEESYDEVYDVLHPRHRSHVLQRTRTSSFYLRQEALGATFGEGNGWERPLWYDTNLSRLADLAPLPTRDDWSAQEWSPAAAAEAIATRSGVAVYDFTSVPRFEVSGPGAVAHLQRLVTGDADLPVGTWAYTLMLDGQGGVLTDITLVRLDAARFLVLGNAPLDRIHLMRGRVMGEGGADEAGVRVTDTSSGTCGIAVIGPRSRDLLAGLTRTDLSEAAYPLGTARTLDVAGVPVLVVRSADIGELGWELYTSADHGLRLWDEVWRAGVPHDLVAAGRLAYHSLRLEHGRRWYGVDVTQEHSPDEAGWGAAVESGGDRVGADLVGTDLVGADFVGAGALAQRRVRQRLVRLRFDDPAHVVLGGEPVQVPGGGVVGYVTSADYGYTTRESIAYAWSRTLLKVGSAVMVAYGSARYPARVVAEPGRGERAIDLAGAADQERVDAGV